MHARRGVQRLCAVPRSGHVGAGDSDLRSRGHLRHGRPLHAAGVAVHPSLREENRRLAPGKHTASCEGPLHHQPAFHLQRGVPTVQAVPTREAPVPHHLHRLRPRPASQVHQPQVLASLLWWHGQHPEGHGLPVARALAYVRRGIHCHQLLRIQEEMSIEIGKLSHV